VGKVSKEKIKLGGGWGETKVPKKKLKSWGKKLGSGQGENKVVKKTEIKASQGKERAKKKRQLKMA